MPLCGITETSSDAESVEVVHGTAAANTRSQNIAINCGFRPTWVETEAVKIEE
jgi:hypothetical protein